MSNQKFFFKCEALLEIFLIKIYFDPYESVLVI
jgi:hypothetical protein